MEWERTYKPMLRPVEAFRMENADEGMISLRDPTQISEIVLSLSEAALHLLALMDGERSCEEIAQIFEEQFGQPVAWGTITKMLDHLDEALLLEGPTFEKAYEALRADYLSKPVRELPAASALCIVDEKGAFFDKMLEGVSAPNLPGKIVGLVAPHLDYPRGEPCYALAYASLRQRPAPKRVIVLGSNHFGRSTSAVVTDRAFRTPLGVTSCDVEFLQRLEDTVGPMRKHELDHLREHSIELQVAWLQHIFGADKFTIVPILCPDACSPSGTKPYDGQGVDLRDLASALAKLIDDSEEDTLMVAGADLSHIGQDFGDSRPVDEEFLNEVREHDRLVLDKIEAHAPDELLSCISGVENETRICSTGCLYTLSATLRDAKPTVLGYHQAVTPEAGICVTCAAVAYT